MEMKITISFVILLAITTQVLSLSFASIDLRTASISSRGFQISGAITKEGLGALISPAGDVNGDGIEDFIVAALLDNSVVGPNSTSGAAYVIYGKAGEDLGDIDLINPLSSDRGFKITGAISGTEIYTISGAGDINGDGIDDIIIGARTASPFGREFAGAGFIIYGKLGGIQTTIDFAIYTLDPAQGLQIYGNNFSGFLGYSANAAGDLNGDGIDDFILGSVSYSVSQDRMYTGCAYIFYGKIGGFDAHIDLNDGFNLSQGFQVFGNATLDAIGTTASRAGDVNGDGIDDVLIGGYSASPLGRERFGAAYVVYGKAGGFQQNVDLSNWTLDQGFQMSGNRSLSYFGYSLSPAGDFNGDGVDDVLVGAHESHINGRTSAGAAYVIYGKIGGVQSHIDLAQPLNPTQLTTFYGNNGDYLGISVSNAGDLNGDGIEDIIIGGYQVFTGRVKTGIVHIIYGKTEGFSEQIDLATPLDSTQGFQIIGAFVGDALATCSSADVNNDGVNDIIVGAQLFDRGAEIPGSALVQDAGKVYVLYGGCAVKNCSLCKSNGFCEVCEAGFILNANGKCDWVAPANGCTTYEEYKYQSGSCLASCDSPFIPSLQSSGRYCNGPCTFGYFLNQDGTCTRTCNSDFIVRAEEGILYCDAPPVDLCTIVYQDNIMTTTCRNENTTCPSNQFQYQNGSCSPLCPVPFSAAIRYGTPFCDSPCSYQMRLYPDGTCSKSCRAGFVETEQNGAKFCVSIPPKETTCVIIQTYVRYDISLDEFNSKDGSSIFIQQLAAPLEIDPSLITIVDVREGSTIVESKITLSSFSDQASVDAIKTRAQALSEKLTYAVEHNLINLFDGIAILDYKSNIQVSDPAPCSPGAYYNDVMGLCEACDPSCSTCSGAGSQACLSCSVLKFLADDKSCKCPAGSVSTGPKACKICEAGFYPNDATGTCEACDPSCPTCFGPGPNACLSCNTQKILANDNSCKCPAGSVSTGPSTCRKCNLGTYPNLVTNTCDACDPSCTTCSESGPNACLSCNGQKVLSSTNSCDCPAGSYSTGPTTCIKCDSSSFFNSQTRKCQDCDNTCATCSGAGPKACSSCSSPKVLTDDKSCKCPPGSVSIGSRICLPCSAGYYPYDPLGLCLRCDSSCATCSGPGPNACLSCSGLKTLSASNSCDCAAGFYPIGSSLCSRCDSSCKTCSGSGKRACTSCASPLVLSSNGMCKAGKQNSALDASDSDGHRNTHADGGSGDSRTNRRFRF